MTMRRVDSSKERLTDDQIRSAINTVRVSKKGSRWQVKKVTDPRIRMYMHKEQALQQAQKLAEPQAWDVVVHGSDGRVVERLTHDLKKIHVHIFPKRTGIKTTRNVL